MKKIILLCILLIAGISCDRSTPEEKIENLGGYWEIKTVEPKEGQPTEYKFNEVIDYIEVEDGAGFRKKMRPQLDGSYATSNALEIFTVKIENDSINLYYETPYDSWKETLISSNENEIKMVNPGGTVYTYTRYTPLSIEDYGKED